MSIANLFTKNDYNILCDSIEADNDIKVGGSITVLPTATGVKFQSSSQSATLEIKNNDVNTLWFNNQKLNGYAESNIYTLNQFNTRLNILTNDITINNMGTIQVNLLAYGANTKIIYEYNLSYTNEGVFVIDQLNPRIFRKEGSIGVEFAENNGVLQLFLTPTETINAKASVFVLDI